MNYEKKYKEALTKARNIVSSINVGLIGKDSFEAVFPELKESKDERIRKEIISYLKQRLKMSPSIPAAIGYWIDWLEKQGKNNMGISEATKQELEDNLNKALEKETPESWNEFLEKQGEQKPVAKYKVGDTIYYNSFGRLVSFVIANIVEDGTDNPMYEDKDGNSVFQNDIVEWKPVFEMITPEESLGIDSDTYNKIVDECIYGDADKVEPKFKVGDWVVYEENIYQIHNISLKKYYECLRTDGTIHTFDFEYIDSKSHLWTIQDAKDGDLLATDNGVCIFDGTLEEGKYPFAYCGLTKQRGFESYNENLPFSHDNNIHPATKEQRDLLFSKMKEAGYEWDTEKKELKEIIDEKQICSEEQHEKESLSEIENRIINFAMQFHDNRMKPEAEWEDELKMLRDNIKIDPWSEEDEKILSRTINDLKFLKNTISIDPNYAVNITDIEREINWFESLKGRVQPQPKWSEDDIVAIDCAVDVLNKDLPTLAASIKRLKSLIPQNRWIPSDEQMKVLKELVEDNNQRYFYAILKSLYEQLKKLKGE